MTSDNDDGSVVDSSSKLSAGTSTDRTETKTSTLNDGVATGENELAKDEARRVRYSKLLVYTVLLVATAACATTTHVFLKKGETKEFESSVSRHSLYVLYFSKQIICGTNICTFSLLAVP